MPIVTAAPVLVDTVNFSRQASNEINPYIGVFGTDLYQVFIIDPIVGHVARIGIFLSTDGGSTWTEQDSAGSPDQGSVSKFTVFFEPGTGSIHVLYQVGDPQKIVTFDTGSNTYGTPTAASLSALNPQGNARNFFYRKSNGDFVVIAGGFGTFSDEMAYFTNIAGVWSTATTFLTGLTNAIVLGGIMDGTDAAHFGYINAGTIFTARLSSAFAVSTPVSQGATAAVNPGDRLSFALYGADSVVLGFTGNSAGSATMIFTIGTPLSNPAWTPTTLDTETGAVNLTYPTVGVTPAGVLQGFWVETDFSGSPVDQLWRAIFDGATWGTPAVFYDEITNPPDNSPPDPTNQFIHTGDVVYLPSGTTVYATTMERIEDAVNYCTGYALLSVVDSQTLQLTKVVDGGTADPTDWTLSADGPTPISGAGGTGPTVVDPGTYELSESTGPSGYTPGAWDCGDAEMPTATSVVVPEGGTVACSITNTATSSPPTPACPVTPGGNGNVGVPFSATITASGGTPPYTFAIIGGALPPGLTLDASTGVISGTPTTAGTYAYTVQVTGS